MPTSESSESSEEDYMSNVFLAKEDTSTQKYTQKRKTKHHPNSPKNKSIKVDMEEKRISGLSTKLGAENKGFQMLQKLGYKEGMKLGLPTKNSSSGIDEPIPLKIKNNRTGLGHDEHQTERAQMAAKQVLQKEQLSKEAFLDLKKAQFLDRQNEKDAKQCRIICQQLDLEHDVKENPFWITQSEVKYDESGVKVIEEEPSEFDILEPSKQLELVNEYLRTTYYYCHWCGEAFSSQSELDSNCPGKTSQDHD